MALRAIGAMVILLQAGARAQQDFTEELLDTLRSGGSLTETQYRDLLARYHHKRLDEEVARLQDTLAGGEESTPSIAYRPGKGFTFQSADERFAMTFNARIFGLYSFTDQDGERRLLGESAADVSSWEIDSARIWLKGHAFDPALGYKMEIESGGGTFAVLDAYLDYNPHPALSAQVGQFRIPVGIQALHPPWAQLLSERSQATNAFELGREIGLMVRGLAGERGELEFDLALTNGDGKGATNADATHRFSAAVRLQPFGAPGGKPAFARHMTEIDLQDLEQPFLSLGASASLNPRRHVRDAAGTIAAPATREALLDLEGQFMWRGFSLQGEWFRRSNDSDPGRTTYDDGYYVQAGAILVPRRLLLAARYAQFDLHPDPILAAGGGIDESRALTLGATLFLSRDNPNAFKIQADWTWLRSDHTALAHRLDESVLRIKLIVIL